MRCRVLSHGSLFVHLLFRYNNLYVFCDFFKIYQIFLFTHVAMEYLLLSP